MYSEETDLEALDLCSRQSDLAVGRHCDNRKIRLRLFEI